MSQTLNLLPLKCFVVVDGFVAHDVQCWGRILQAQLSLGAVPSLALGMLGWWLFYTLLEQGAYKREEKLVV